VNGYERGVVMSVRLHLPCLHEVGQAPADQEVPDYHPLVWEEVVYLLTVAAEASAVGDYQTASSVQVRLCQGIPGYTCPRQVEGPVLEMENAISALFVENYGRGPDPEFVDQLCRLLQI
jgi:hypothetical protein